MHNKHHMMLLHQNNRAMHRIRDHALPVYGIFTMQFVYFVYYVMFMQLMNLIQV